MSNKKSDKRISMTVKEKDIPAGIQPFSQFMIDNRGVDIPEYAFMIQPPNNYIICNAIQYARIKKTIGTQFSFTNFNDSCYLYILDDDKGDNCFFSPNLSNLDSITEYTDNNLVFTFLNNRGSFSTKKNNVKIVRYKRDKKTIFQRGADVEEPPARCRYRYAGGALLHADAGDAGGAWRPLDRRLAPGGEGPIAGAGGEPWGERSGAGLRRFGQRQEVDTFM